MILNNYSSWGLKTNSGWWYTYPSEKSWSSSLGMMTFPTEWKNEIHVPNHQPEIDELDLEYHLDTYPG